MGKNKTSFKRRRSCGKSHYLIVIINQSYKYIIILIMFKYLNKFYNIIGMSKVIKQNYLLVEHVSLDLKYLLIRMKKYLKISYYMQLNIAQLLMLISRVLLPMKKNRQIEQRLNKEDFLKKVKSKEEEPKIQVPQIYLEMMKMKKKND